MRYTKAQRHQYGAEINGKLSKIEKRITILDSIKSPESIALCRVYVKTGKLTGTQWGQATLAINAHISAVADLRARVLKRKNTAPLAY